MPNRPRDGTSDAYVSFTWLIGPGVRRALLRFRKLREDLVEAAAKSYDRDQGSVPGVGAGAMSTYLLLQFLGENGVAFGRREELAQ